MEKTWYEPLNDPMWKKPFVDIDEWQDGIVRYRYVHGGFEGTETKFAFFYPEESVYKQRFFHFMAPVQGSENADMETLGEPSKIAFAITHGSYYVETNMGVAIPFAPIPDPTIIYKASAAAAEYSRKIANDMYGHHRAYGYLYGGSGGAFKTISCMENTQSWDGAVPFVPGSPMAIPNCFTVRAHARRVLRHKLTLIADAVKPGGGDMYAGLNEEEHAALEEATKMGFPPRVWYMGDKLDDGALPLLAPIVHAVDPTYFNDFWSMPGYLGAEEDGSAVRDRIKYTSTIKSVYVPGYQNTTEDDNRTGVDEAWQRSSADKELDERPYITLAELPQGDLYIYGTVLTVLSGESAGLTVPLERYKGDTVYIGAGFGIENMLERLSKIRSGDNVSLDNSDYIAIQTYHRHQLPDESYAGWAQFRDESGKPLYPQRDVLTGPIVAMGGAGSIQTGQFHGKMIMVATLLDYDALPWQPDWYRQKVYNHLGSKELDSYRLWYYENAVHGLASDEYNMVSYLGILNQALLDVSEWVERGVPSAESTTYDIKDAQVVVSNSAELRKGIQPVIALTADKKSHTVIHVGESVQFEAVIDLPVGTGKITMAEWRFDGNEQYVQCIGTSPFPVKAVFLKLSDDGTSAFARATYKFKKPGVYFPVIRVYAHREGNVGSIFTQIKNIASVRVTVQQ